MSYVIHELPDVDDPHILRCCLSVQNLRLTLSKFTEHVVSQLKQRYVAIPTRVAVMIALRMTEGAVSIELLCLKNRVRDSAILLLSLYELQLDLQYISQDPSRAERWIDHTKEETKPWRVMTQLNEMYADPTELAAEKAIYRRYSMTKHCNPLGRNSSFPITFSRHFIQLDVATENSPALPFHIFGLENAYVERVERHREFGQAKDWMLPTSKQNSTQNLLSYRSTTKSTSNHFLVDWVSQWQTLLTISLRTLHPP